MRAEAPGQSALLMLDVIDVLDSRGVGYAVIGAMAAALHGLVRASLDADLVVSLRSRESAPLKVAFDEIGLSTDLRVGDPDDPIPALLEVTDTHGNRVDLLFGLRGLDPGLFERVILVGLFGESIQIVGREDFIAMKVFAGGPQDLNDARAAIALDPATLDLELLRALAARFGRETASGLEALLAERN
jgi:hypothetical protein